MISIRNHQGHNDLNLLIEQIPSNQFIYEIISDNELFIQIHTYTNSIYITLDYLEIEERYSASILKNKAITEVINESTIDELIKKLNK